MGKSTNRALLNEHTRRYIEEIWADRLRQEGFTCPDDKLLCWYRVVNQEICQFLLFFTAHGQLPVFLEACYGSWPLWEQPPYLRTVYCPLYPASCADCRCSLIVESQNSSMAIYSAESYVFVEARGGKGVLMLDNAMLPFWNETGTLEKRFAHRKKEIELELIDVMKEISPSEITYMNIVSPLHSEMAILFNDENTYPMSIKEADAYINCYEKYENSEKCPSYILKKLKQRWYMKSVLEEGRRDEFLLHLEQRKQKTIKWLQKMGIPV